MLYSGKLYTAMMPSRQDSVWGHVQRMITKPGMLSLALHTGAARWCHSQMCSAYSLLTLHSPLQATTARRGHASMPDKMIPCQTHSHHTTLPHS